MESQILIAHLPAVRTLVMVVDSGSFTEVAKRLRVTPSGVSKQLGRLEELLGVRLFERTTRKVRPTLAGLTLSQRARPLLESLEDAARDARREAEQIAGRVRISAAPALGRAVLMPALHALSRLHADLRFEVTLTGRRLDLVEDEIDLAIREGTLTDSSLIARPLFPAIVGLYASPAYVKAHRAPRTLADLSRHDLLLLPRSNVVLPRGVRKLALTPRFQVDDLFAVAELAEAGAGIAALPDYLAGSRIARGSLVRILPRTDIARFPVHAVYPSRRHLPRRVEVVIEALSSVRAVDR